MGGSCLLFTLQTGQPRRHCRCQQVHTTKPILSIVGQHTRRLGQSEATALGHRVEVYKARFDGFGWNAIIVDGHDIMAVCKAFMAAATTKDKPTVLIAETLKG